MQQFLFTVILVFLMLALGVATWYSGRLLRTFVPPQNLLLTIPDNVLRLGLILLCLALGTWLGPGPAALGWETGHFLRDLALGTAAAAVLAPVLSWAGAAAERRWGADIYDKRLLRAIVPANRREWLAVVLVLLPAAALEELLFRSLPLGSLPWLASPWMLASPDTAASMMASPWVIAWPLSLLFGLMHASQGPWGIVGTALMGLVLSALFLLSGSIWVPIVTHWLLNATELTLAQRNGLRPLRYDRDTAA